MFVEPFAACLRFVFSLSGLFSGNIHQYYLIDGQLHYRILWRGKFGNEAFKSVTRCHGGLFNILSVETNTVISIFSIDDKYRAGNLFGDGVLSRIASEIVK